MSSLRTRLAGHREHPQSANGQLTPAALRTPSAAGWAGILFAVLFTLAVVLIHLAAPANPDDVHGWLGNPTGRTELHVGLTLVPFCGIFFLWFMGAVRSQIGDREDKFFGTLYLGSGLLFLAMLFILAALFVGLITVTNQHSGTPPNDLWRFGRSTIYNITNSYGLRMAAVFTISTSMIALKLRLHHRWITWSGFLVGILLLVTATTVPWIELVFPAWVFAVSVNILLRTRAGATPASVAAASAAS
jgi:hypothetical protein